MLCFELYTFIVSLLVGRLLSVFIKVSVFLYCIGYVRLELEIRAYKERLKALEQREKQLVATPVPSIPTSTDHLPEIVLVSQYADNQGLKG